MRSVPLKLSGIFSLLTVNFTYPLVFSPAWICASAACRRKSSLVQVVSHVVNSLRQYRKSSFVCGHLPYSCGHLFNGLPLAAENQRHRKGLNLPLLGRW